jgi:hypothetical protein
VASLDEFPGYEALSYVWGDPEITFPILIDGQSYHVTENLHVALQKMRRKTEPRLMWVDAICIDQGDSAEKSQQVEMMGSIFANSKSVAVWLGDYLSHGFTEAEAQAAFDVIHMIAESKPRELETAYERVSGALHAIMDSPWWLRSWTVQEIVLASSAIVIWGSVLISWDILQAAASVLIGDETPDLPFEMPSVFDGHRFTGPIVGIKCLKDRKSRNDSQLEILWRVRHRSSTDPRDKIFAVAALLPEDSNIKADYFLSTVQLYQKVTLDLIRSSGTLDCLLGYRGEEKQTPGLPSWVVDWSQSSDPLARTCRCWKHWFSHWYFSADGGLSVSMHDNGQNQQSALTLKGLQIDRVKIVGGPTMQEAVQDYGKDLPLRETQKAIKQWRQLAHTTFEESFTSKIHRRSWNEAFWRTMAGDLIFYTDIPCERASSFHRLLFEEFLRADDPELLDDEGEIYNTYSCNIVNQAFFITEKGYMGTGPPDIAAGDEIWVLLGSTVPFVLRSIEEGTIQGDVSSSEPPNAAGEFHLVLGDCYVHGIMDGEAMIGSEEGLTSVTLL